MNDEVNFWLLSLTTRDNAGDTAAIATVFSGRGIQIDSLTGFGGNAPKDGLSQGQIVITFYAFEERSKSLCRLLQSLEAVVTVSCYSQEQIPQEWLEKSRQIKAAFPNS